MAAGGNSAGVTPSALGGVTVVNNITNNNGGGGTTAFSALTDVTLSTPLWGNLLEYNGSKWVNVATSSLGIVGGGGSSFAYLFPNNATSTSIAFNGGTTARTLAVGGTATTTIDAGGNLLVQGGTSAGTSLDVNGTANALYYNVQGSQFIDNSKNANFNSINVNSGKAGITSSGNFTAYASSTIGSGTQVGGLTINGGATTTGNGLVQGTLTTNGTIQVKPTVTGNGQIDLIANDSSPVHVASLFENYNDYSFNIQNKDTYLNSGINFFTQSSASVPKFVIKNDGSIGIGTTSPQARFEVANDGSGNPSLAINGTSTQLTYMAIRNYESASPTFGQWGLLMGYAAGANQFFNGTAQGDVAIKSVSGDGNKKLFLGAGAGSPLVIDTTGNVGIGTTSPFSTLSVAGDTYLSGNLTATGALAVAGNGSFTSSLSASIGSASATSTWTDRTGAGTRDWRSIAASSDGTKLVAVVYGGDIYTSTDSGANWTDRTGAGARNWILVASSVDGAKLAAADSNGYIYTSTDSGANWTAQTNSGQRAWGGLAMSSDGTKIAATAYTGYIYTSTDSGANWTAQTNSGIRNWQFITSSSDGTKLAAVDFGGNIYTSTDSGANWSSHVISGSGTVWYAITSSANGSVIAAADNNGYLYLSTDGGANWAAMTGAGTHAWHGLAMSSDGTKIAAVSYGNIYLSGDTGTTWTTQTNAGSKNWNSVAASSDLGKLAATVVTSGDIYTAAASYVGTTGLTVSSTGNVGIGSSTPGTLLSLGSTNGINFSTATSTFNAAGGVNIASGCYAVRGTCITGGGVANLYASTTIGDGTQAGGLTVSGGATTTGRAYFAGLVGVGSTTPWARLSVDTSSLAAGVPEFAIGSSSRQDFVVTQSGNVGIGTSNPGGSFHIVNNQANPTKFILQNTNSSGQEVQIFAGSANQWNFGQANSDGNFKISFDGNGNLNSSTVFAATTGGNVGIGTTTPYAALSVVGPTGIVADKIFATSTVATSTFAGGLNVGSGQLTYDLSSGVTSINNLALGSLNFDVDAGIVNWADLPVDSSATAGTVQSYTANVGGSPVLTVYGLADGVGGVASTSVGIGTTTPAYLLDVATSSSGVVVARFTNGTGSCTINPTSGSLGCSSDERLKTNFAAFDASTTLAKVVALNPLFYNWVNEASGTPEHSGFLAQDVQQLFPDLVATDTASGFLTLNYAGFTPYFASAIHEIATLGDSFKTTLINWLADAQNGIGKLFAKEVHTDKLCVGDTCVTQAQFLAMVEASGGGAGSPPSAPVSPPAPSANDATSTPPADDATSTPPTIDDSDASSTPPVVDDSSASSTPPVADTPPADTPPDTDASSTPQ